MPKKASEVDKIMDLLRAEFKRAPWWVGPIGIGIAYLLFYFVIPFIAGLVGGGDDSPVKITEMIAKVCQMGAPLVAGAVGLIWIIALIDKFTDNHRLDRQSGIDTIRELSWREFEQLLATTYERQGYRVTDTGQTHGRAAPDGGIDLILEKDGKRILVQCKQWKARKVGVKIARELYGLVASQHADGGILITSGHYTQDAHKFAEKLPLKLIDGPKLETLVLFAQGKVKPKRVSQAKIAKSAKPALAAKSQSAPLCPTCQSNMIQRSAKRGSKAGQSFWGCSDYPNCRGTRSI